MIVSAPRIGPLASPTLAAKLAQAAPRPLRSSVAQVPSTSGMAAPHVAGILANIVYWEALNQKYDSAFYATFKMSVANSLKNIMSAFPGNRPYKFATTGINNGWKADDEPVSCSVSCK